MYSLAGDRHGATWREFTAAVSAAGGALVAMEAVERVDAQRSARGRAVRAGGPAPEPGLLPPAPAARRWSCLDTSQRSRRLRHLLRPRCPTGDCKPASRWIKTDRLHPLIPRETLRWRKLYKGRAAVEREFGRLKNEWRYSRCGCVGSSAFSFTPTSPSWRSSPAPSRGREPFPSPHSTPPRVTGPAVEPVPLRLRVGVVFAPLAYHHSSAGIILATGPA
jgi:hypothetical protein